MEHTLNILIVEDELIVAEELMKLLQSKGYIIIDTVPSSDEAQECLENNYIDLVLIDINIQGSMDGIELGQLIRKECNCPIIFLTAYSDEVTLARAKKIHPEAYLVKPFENRNLLVSIDIAIENFHNNEERHTQKTRPVEYVFLKENNKYVRVMMKEIVLLEALGSYCKVVTTNKEYMYSFNLKTAIAKFQHPNLVRVHRSFMVNVKNVEELDVNAILVAGRKVPIGYTYKDAVTKHFNLI